LRTVCRPASREVRSMSAPLPMCSACVHSHRRCRQLRPLGDHPRSRVPSMWFLTTSTAFSAREVPGLLHPGTERGSRRFRCVDTAVTRTLRRESCSPSRRTRFPAAPFAPLEEVPPLAAASHHCDRCPLDVAPLVADSAETGTVRATLILGALLRHRVWCATKLLPAEPRPLLPWASFPSKVLTRPE
jgi:hypothetical protein